ncbi:hypothetical protein K2P96_02310 [Patescibacteria group bacterium]|nr:hypothetical protein [Patescibacteria group bacterium]
MKTIIHKLRQQPEEVRTHILHLTTICAAVVLGFLWIYSLGTNLSSAETQKQTKEGTQPFSVLKDNLVGGYNSIKTSDQSDKDIDMSVLQ